jgi:UDP-3-O-[3-hydroxymyristoyl] glucosamine N-acyltransferase
MLGMSYLSDSAIIPSSVTIGRFCIIEDNVTLEEGVVVEDYAMIGSGSKVGENTVIGTYTKVGKDVTIGSNCSFTSFCEIRDECKLGNRVLMGSRGTLSARTIVEDDVIMKYAFVVTDTPNLNDNNMKTVGVLREGSKFGASVVIMPSVEIGRNAEIGACSQVRKDVPAGETWFGIPAKFYR